MVERDANAIGIIFFQQIKQLKIQIQNVLSTFTQLTYNFIANRTYREGISQKVDFTIKLKKY